MNASADPVNLFGVQLIGATPENLHKALLTIGFIVAAYLVLIVLRAVLRLFIGSSTGTKFHFWARQALSLLIAAALFIGIASIWFDNPARLAAVLGLITAGLAFAMQRVITAIAGYFVILRGKTFNVGDRIVMGGVRGDVIGLSFMQTKIMEMGQAPSEQGDAPAMWIKSRQFTGRIVTVTNDKIFDEPVYNYTDEFPYIWEEMNIAVPYTADHERAEEILLQAVRRHALVRDKFKPGEMEKLEQSYGLDVGSIEPRVFWRLTDNWLELAARFLSPDHGSRDIKDAISREILKELQRADIPIASTSFEIVGLPTLRIRAEGPSVAAAER